MLPLSFAENILHRFLMVLCRFILSLYCCRAQSPLSLLVRASRRFQLRTPRGRRSLRIPNWPRKVYLTSFRRPVSVDRYCYIALDLAHSVPRIHVSLWCALSPNRSANYPSRHSRRLPPGSPLRYPTSLRSASTLRFVRRRPPPPPRSTATRPMRPRRLVLPRQPAQ